LKASSVLRSGAASYDQPRRWRIPQRGAHLARDQRRRRAEQGARPPALPAAVAQGERSMNRRTRRALAWGVHFYTGLGLACAARVAVLIVEGSDAAFRQAFWLLALATLIDATDGTLARAIHIKEVLPRFDGRRLDDLIDFLTYTSLPLLLVWRAKLLPEGAEA